MAPQGTQGRTQSTQDPRDHCALLCVHCGEKKSSNRKKALFL
jgi:hypothetical protein